MEKTLHILTIVVILGTGLIAGVFFIFSVAIMRALERVSPAAGMTAMQSINLVIINPMFLGVFLGTAVVCTVLAVCSVLRWEHTGTAWLLAGAFLYLVGSFVVTIVFNVPMNNALAAADPASSNGHEVWTNYLSNWTFWNHVRTMASIASSASFVMAISQIR